MGRSLLSVRDIKHKYIVVEKEYYFILICAIMILENLRYVKCMNITFD